MKFAACMAVSFITFLRILLVSFFVSLYVWFVFCLLLLNFVNYIYFYCYVYVFLLLCMFRSVYSVSLCRSVYCLCVNVYCTAATGWLPNCT